jgi:hypothetical protein
MRLVVIDLTFVLFLNARPNSLALLQLKVLLLQLVDDVLVLACALQVLFHHLVIFFRQFCYLFVSLLNDLSDLRIVF